MSKKVLRNRFLELLRQKEARENRVDNPYTPHEAGKIAGVSHNTIEAWMQYEYVEQLFMPTVFKLCTFLECSKDDLLVEETVEEGEEDFDPELMAAQPL